MYDLITRLAERKADTKFLKIEWEPQFKIIFLDKNSQIHWKETEHGIKEASDMEKEAITDLVQYLTRLKFLNLSTEPNKYEIAGVLEDVPLEVKTLTKEENEFLKQYERLEFFMIVYANLYDKYAVGESV